MTSGAPLRDLVVIGASAGGVEALRSLVSRLPSDLPAGVLIVLHLPAGSSSALAGILDAAGDLPVTQARHATTIESGHLYVAPPDHHLVVEGNQMMLTSTPAENGHRPAINVLFRSAALARGSAVAGVILSGVLDDGTAGLTTIKSRGGLAIVQHPDDAAFPGMPDSALANVQVDHVLPAAAIGARLEEILGAPAGLICPDCGNALSLLSPDQDRFRCQSGHSWSADALLDTADHEMQAALWTAVRTLDEKTTLASRMAATAEQRGNHELARRYTGAVDETGRAARLLRDRLTAGRSEVAKDGEAR
jgi:two-component system chemotaxis response regulator CheB